ncbi:hypothetical protein PFICI_00244 [Pestalotiopsis fici W106-1]|uniref:NACHT-NTPase and P-loop NTPases N-terminal domain-containing protein n=1 Tax=Pestalotiopsis fici (strain W106-1 / CGMCC3.15140) TaxID=1229662 RepID=W3XMB7_PESFW|nr:uncharacterized protein PFICI_00244 [Pestalotiopsis fici W106-1]ETS86416.1 hypothetical protein PFICI_00244 [Pestalotiopsis fici W106-1]
MDDLSTAASLAGFTHAINKTREAVRAIKDLSTVFEHVDRHLDLAQRTLNDVQTQQSHGTLTKCQSYSHILHKYDEETRSLQLLFHAFEEECQTNQDPASWLNRWRHTKVRTLMTNILEYVKMIVGYEPFTLATRDDMEEIEKALEDMSQVEPSMDDSGTKQMSPVSNSQDVALGGHGQQNTPLGGYNTFNSGYNIDGGYFNIGEAY